MPKHYFLVDRVLSGSNHRLNTSLVQGFLHFFEFKVGMKVQILAVLIKRFSAKITIVIFSKNLSEFYKILWHLRCLIVSCKIYDWRHQTGVIHRPFILNFDYRFLTEAKNTYDTSRPFTCHLRITFLFNTLKNRLYLILSITHIQTGSHRFWNSIALIQVLLILNILVRWDIPLLLNILRAIINHQGSRNFNLHFLLACRVALNFKVLLEDFVFFVVIFYVLVRWATFEPVAARGVWVVFLNMDFWRADVSFENFLPNKLFYHFSVMKNYLVFAIKLNSNWLIWRLFLMGQVNKLREFLKVILGGKYILWFFLVKYLGQASAERALCAQEVILL